MPCTLAIADAQSSIKQIVMGRLIKILIFLCWFMGDSFLYF